MTTPSTTPSTGVASAHPAPAAPSLLPRLSRAAWQALALYGVAGVYVTLLRLLTRSVYQATGRLNLGIEVSNGVPLPLLLLVLAGVGGLLVRQRWPRLHPAALVAVTLGLAAALLALGGAFGPWWLRTWIAPDRFEVLRWDGLVLLTLGVLYAQWLTVTRGVVRGLGIAVSYGLALLLMLVPTLEFGYLLAVGTLGDAHILLYAVRNIASIAPTVGAEIDPAKAALLAMPVLVLLLAGLLHTRFRSLATRPPRGHAWGLVPVVLLLVATPRVPLDPPQSGGSYAQFVGGLWLSPAERAVIESAMASGPPPPVDTRGLRFVATDSTRKLNVVVILLESARARSVTPYNDTLDTTPFLAELAARSLLVEHLYTVIGRTNKAITPVFTGTYPYLRVDQREAVPGALPGVGLPALLQAHGYTSGFFSSADNTFEDRLGALHNFGFAHAVGMETLDQAGFYRQRTFGYEDRRILQPTFDWLDAVPTGQPFFLSLLTLIGHHPYDTPTDFPLKTYPGASEDLNRHYNTLRYMDGWLRDLFAGFEARGLYENTVFFILADHGQAFGENGVRGHNVPYDVILHVPGLVFAPALFPEGGRITGPRQQIDLLPTVADVLKMRVEGPPLPGQSLLRPVPADRPLYFSDWNGDYLLAVRRGSLKAIYYYNRLPTEVYDIEKDPLETTNIAGDLPPGTVLELEQMALRWKNAVDLAYGDVR